MALLGFEGDEMLGIIFVNERSGLLSPHVSFVVLLYALCLIDYKLKASKVASCVVTSPFCLYLRCRFVSPIWSIKLMLCHFVLRLHLFLISKTRKYIMFFELEHLVLCSFCNHLYANLGSLNLELPSEKDKLPQQPFHLRPDPRSLCMQDIESVSVFL